MERVEFIVAGLRESLVECLYCTRGCRALILYDSTTAGAARTLAEAVRAIGGEPDLVDLDPYRSLQGGRLESLPGELRDKIRGGYDATFYAAGVLPGELPFRRSLIEEAMEARARHVHMPRVNMRVLEAAAACREAADATMRAFEILQGARRVVATAPRGTRLEIEVGGYRWVPDTGVIEPGEWGNWPAGEVYTTPDSVDGVLVVDGVLGDYFSTKYGVLREPVRLAIERGRIVEVEGGPVARELYEYLSSAGECGLRIGEVGIGTNPAVREPIGIVLHDEKMPGIHLAAGDPLGEQTGARWQCSVHVDMVPLRASVEVGGLRLVSAGRLKVNRL